MKKSMLKSVQVVSIILILVGMSVVPSSGKLIDNKPIILVNNGNTLYVGGNGPGNYTKIQDAIDKASDGDTVFVYDDSSPYYEHIVIEKTINLIGENRNTTVIDGMGEKDKDIVTIMANQVKVSSFTIQNASYVTTQGVQIRKGNENIITNNIFTNNNGCISIHPYPYYNDKSDDNIISYNIVKNSGFSGIYLVGSSNNLVTHNIVQNNGWGGGINVDYGKNNLVTYNDITYNNATGLMLWAGSKNKIFNNNICWNKRDAKNVYCKRPKWDGNYWGETRSFPKILLGKGRIYLFTRMVFPREYEHVYLYFPKIDVDWHPAKEPYDI